MGLRDELQADLAQAFDTDLADAVAVIDGSRAVQGDYDPEQGGSVSTNVRYTGRGIFGQYAFREVDGTRILASDMRLKSLQSELFMMEGDEITSVTAAPAVGDRISGYRVMNVGEDPAKAIWTIQLRK
jgi:hypothetical protein